MHSSRHFLRRYHTLQRRMADGECRVVKITDDLMPADFLTKWVPKEKLKRSVDHASKQRASSRGALGELINAASAGRARPATLGGVR